MAGIRDVAKLAGVSASAVSKYLKTPQNMREENREKIAEAIQKLNYQPNQLARGLRSGRSGIIAVTIPDALNPYFSRYMVHMQNFCNKSGLIPLLLQVSTDNEAQNAIRLLNSGLLDGVICYDDGWFSQAVREAGVRIPMLPITPTSDKPVSPSIQIDLRSGLQLLCRHLEEQGARTVGYIGPLDDLSSAQKYQTIQSYCCTHALAMEEDALLFGCYDYDDGFQSCKKLLDSKGKLPDAIICSSDMVAMGVLKCFTQNGLEVPENILLTGYDDTEIAIMNNPSVTSVHIPLQDICGTAVRMMSEMIEGKNVGQVSFETGLSVRTSTLAKKNAAQAPKQAENDAG